MIPRTIGQPPLIGLTGLAGSGKDTIAAHLVNKGQYAHVAFADPIRRGITTMFCLSPDMLQHPNKEKPIPMIGKSPRELMQTLGTEWGRNLVHPDVWLKLAAEQIDVHLQFASGVVVSDVRFENEAALIRQMGGVIWHVRRLHAGTKHQHTSESGIAFLCSDKCLYNDSTIEQLLFNVDGLCE
jgi:hypothetical protein